VVAEVLLWDDSKVIALQLTGAILSNFLVEKIMQLTSFTTAWDMFVMHIRDAFLLNGCAVSAPVLCCLNRALKPTAATAAAAVDDNGPWGSLVVVWENVWAWCEEMGTVIMWCTSAAQHEELPVPFTQDKLVMFVDAHAANVWWATACAQVR
jgi:hypothetical protein